MDFSQNTFKLLVETLHKQGFLFKASKSFDGEVPGRNVILRHDVDRQPELSLQIAHIEKEMGIKGIYYFRSVKESWDKSLIEQIAEMGHEVGYHYEDVSLMADSMGHGALLRTFGASADRAWGRGKKIQEKELIERSIESFERNLESLRKLVPVKSICMHGSPMSKWDSRLLWKYYDYKDSGIEYEPYFDVNFEDRLYLTDTGRRWNGSSVSVRDRAKSKERRAKSYSSAVADEGGGNGIIGDSYSDWVRKPITGSLMNMTAKAIEFQAKYNFRHTKDIIRAIDSGDFPEKVMMTFHPQRWTDKPLPWLKELVWQNAENVGKYFIIKIRG